MEFLLLLAIPVAAVWSVVALRQPFVQSIWQPLRAHPLPLLGIGVIAATVVVGYDFFHLKAGPIPLTIDRGLLMVLAGLCGVHYLQGRENLRPLNRGDYAILSLLVLLTVNTLMHDWKYLENMPLSRLLFFYMLPVVLYFVMRTIRLQAIDLKRIAMIFVAIGVYLAVTAIAEAREIQSLVFPKYILDPGEFYGRGRGPLLNPVINGILMVIGCGSLWLGWPQSSTRRRGVIVALTALLTAGIFYTLTRSVWMGYVACGALLIWYPASRQMKGTLWIAGVLALIVSLPILGEKLFSFKRDKEVSQSEMEESAKLRPMFAEVAWSMFQDRPLLGCGFGQYLSENEPYLKSAHTDRPLERTRIYSQHNVFLAYLCETGLLGLGVFLVLLSIMALDGWRLWKNPQKSLLSRQFGLLVIAMLLCYAVNGMFHDVSIIPLANGLLLFLYGVVNNLNTEALQSQP